MRKTHKEENYVPLYTGMKQDEREMNTCERQMPCYGNPKTEKFKVSNLEHVVN